MLQRHKVRGGRGRLHGGRGRDHHTRLTRARPALANTRQLQDLGLRGLAVPGADGGLLGGGRGGGQREVDLYVEAVLGRGLLQLE